MPADLLQRLMHWLGPAMEHRLHLENHLSAADVARTETRINGHEQRLESLRAELAVIRHEVQQSTGTHP